MAESKMHSRIQSIRQDFSSELEEIKSNHDLERIRIAYAGRKGIISELFKALGNIPPEERKTTGRLLNDLKKYVQTQITEKEKSLTSHDAIQQIDVTLPG